MLNTQRVTIQPNQHFSIEGCIAGWSRSRVTADFSYQRYYGVKIPLCRWIVGLNWTSFYPSSIRLTEEGKRRMEVEGEQCVCPLQIWSICRREQVCFFLSLSIFYYRKQKTKQKKQQHFRPQVIHALPRKHYVIFTLTQLTSMQKCPGIRFAKKAKMQTLKE